MSEVIDYIFYTSKENRYDICSKGEKLVWRNKSGSESQAVQVVLNGKIAYVNCNSHDSLVYFSGIINDSYNIKPLSDYFNK